MQRCGMKLRRKFVTNDDGTLSCVGWESDNEEGAREEWHVANTKNLEEESTLIEACFEYVSYSDKDSVTICHKRK